MARRKRKNQEEVSGSGNWLTTFSDLMSLLLTFFILLFSMSNVSEAKFSSASQSIQKALTGETGGSTILDEVGISNLDTGNEIGVNEEETNDIPQQVTKMYEEAMAIIESEGIGDQISVSSDQDGVYLDIQESILFDSGQAQISEIGQETLNSLTKLLESSDNDIIVEGFTDNVPMNSVKYPSNWELSADRAMSVVRYLVEKNNIEPSRMSGRGYGEFNPVVPNDTPENRAKNRRVNIVLVYQPEEEFE